MPPLSELDVTAFRFSTTFAYDDDVDDSESSCFCVDCVVAVDDVDDDDGGGVGVGGGGDVLVSTAAAFADIAATVLRRTFNDEFIRCARVNCKKSLQRQKSNCAGQVRKTKKQNETPNRQTIHEHSSKMLSVFLVANLCGLCLGYFFTCKNKLQNSRKL